MTIKLEPEVQKLYDEFKPWLDQVEDGPHKLIALLSHAARMVGEHAKDASDLRLGLSFAVSYFQEQAHLVLIDRIYPVKGADDGEKTN